MKPLHILLLEDDPQDAELTLSQLTTVGIEHKVTRVDKRATYLAQLQARCYDVILADYRLPTFDGAAALKIAQELYPHTPFILVSGAIGEELAIEILKQGATDYVLKQRLSRLGPAVERALREAVERAERLKMEAALRTLSEASSVLASSLDYETTLANVARLAIPNFADYCIVDVLAEDGSAQRMAVAHNDDAKADLARELSQYSPAMQGAHPLVPTLSSGQATIVPEIPDALLAAIAHDPRHQDIIRQLKIECIMIVPLIAHGRILGGITFARRTAHTYGDADLRLAEDLARRAALALDNARLYREAQQANRTKDEFLATISHELRTPLTAILGWTHLLRTDQLDNSEAQRALESIERNAKAQAELIGDILDVSRTITGKLNLAVTSLDLMPIVRAALETAYPAANAKQIRLIFEPDNAVAMVVGDTQRLQQIVWNLLSNAIKFTSPEGQVRVLLQHTVAHVQLIIEDSGQGIKAEFLPHVFDRFRQADSTSTRQHGGLGLGLAIVRHLVEAHGGTVQVTSPGEAQGATFTVNLPRPSSTAPADALPQVQAAIEAALLGNGQNITRPKPPETLRRRVLDNLHLLLVEDEVDARLMVATALRQAGAKVTPVASAQDAFSAFTKSRPDLLISDIAMPDEDGYQLLQRLRAFEAQPAVANDGVSARHAVPAIALTAYTRPEDRQRALDAGFQAHIAKPIGPDELVTLVADLMQATRAEA